MRSVSQIINAAFGDPSESVAFEGTTVSSEYFRAYTVSLPTSFQKGLPLRWLFLVLQPSMARVHADDRVNIVADATRIIEERRSLSRFGEVLVFASDNPAVRLSAEMPENIARVFFLDSDDLPGKRGRPQEPRLSPIILTIRRALTSEATAGFFCPYIPNRPTKPWRFFGRKKELQRLVHSQENIMVVGARKIGKTSLLVQVAHELRAQGHHVFEVDVEDCRDGPALIDRLIRDISPKYHSRLSDRTFRTQAPEQALLGAIRRESQGKNAVLIIDELGNAISRFPRNQWSVIGVLRQSVQHGTLRIIGSAFQEYFQAQRDDYESPWVNFASTLRLSGLTEEELTDFAVEPFAIWSDVRDRNALKSLVAGAVGTHPLLLQYFCAAVFSEMAKRDTSDVLAISKSVVGLEISYFSEAVEEMFFRLPSPTIKYLYLLACHQANLGTTAHRDVAVVLDDDWLEDELKKAGHASSTTRRREILELLSLRGLTEPLNGDVGRQKSICPIIYRYISRTQNNMQALLEKYKAEIASERAQG